MLRVVKYLAYGWSSRRSLPGGARPGRAGAGSGPLTGWEGLLAEQREYLDAFWATADVEIDGDAELQQAVRVAVFHVLQAGARAERRAIGAKGLTGPRLRRAHVLGHRDLLPAGAHHTCSPTRRPTRCAGASRSCRWPTSGPSSWGSPGAAFPWRTIRGQECSGYWPAGTAAFHINADIADAVRRHVLPPATPSSSARSGWSSWSPPRGCGARWATTTRRASSASTGSPAPTSTPRSSTTTSTPTSWRS